MTEAKNEPNLFQTKAEDEDNDEDSDLDDAQEPTGEETIQKVKRIHELATDVKLLERDANKLRSQVKSLQDDLSKAEKLAAGYCDQMQETTAAACL